MDISLDVIPAQEGIQKQSELAKAPRIKPSLADSAAWREEIPLTEQRRNSKW